MLRLYLTPAKRLKLPTSQNRHFKLSKGKASKPRHFQIVHKAMKEQTTGVHSWWQLN